MNHHIIDVSPPPLYGSTEPSKLNAHSRSDAANDPSGPSVEITSTTTSTHSHSPPTANRLLDALWISPDLHHQIGSLDRSSGRFRNIPIGNVGEALSMAQELSASGRDAYIACAEYENSTNRTAANAKGASAFWADIDAGADKAAGGKGYSDVVQINEALREFTGRTGFPIPTHLVNSGSGLHVYWVVDSFIKREDWLKHAVKLKAIFKACGLLADPSRTADIASVLRVPGTMNYKYDTPRPVRLLVAEAVVGRDELLRCIDDVHKPPTCRTAHSRSQVVRPNALARMGRSLENRHAPRRC